MLDIRLPGDGAKFRSSRWLVFGCPFACQLALDVIKFIAQEVFYLLVLLCRVVNVGKDAPDGARDCGGVILRPRHV